MIFFHFLLQVLYFACTPCEGGNKAAKGGKLSSSSSVSSSPPLIIKWSRHNFCSKLYVIFIQLLDENRLLRENLSIVQKVFPDDEALNVDGNGDDNDDDFNDDTRN